MSRFAPRTQGWRLAVAAGIAAAIALLALHAPSVAQAQACIDPTTGLECTPMPPSCGLPGLPDCPPPNQEPEPTRPRPTARPTATVTETPSPTTSPTPSPSATGTSTETLTTTPTETVTLTPSATSTASATASPTATAPATRTLTRTPTRTLTKTATQPPPTASNTSPAPPTEGAPSDTPDGQPTQAPATATPTTEPTASTCAASANSSVEAEVISLVNDERVAQGLAAYSVDSRLRAAARVHAADMACNHFTSRTGSDGSSVRDRVEAQGYTWSWIGENYYVGGSGAQTAFDWWMNSTAHRNNLLSPNYTQFGLGYMYDADSDYGGYFVVVFAKPG